MALQKDNGLYEGRKFCDKTNIVPILGLSTDKMKAALPGKDLGEAR